MNKQNKDFTKTAILFAIVSVLGTVATYGLLAAVVFWIAKLMFGI